MAAYLAAVKLLLNSVVSTKDANFTTADIKDFFYASFLPDPEYMKMKLRIIPQNIIDQYQLQDLQENGWVYMKIVKDMPGLKQSARLANERLVHHLASYGYATVQSFSYTSAKSQHTRKSPMAALSWTFDPRKTKNIVSASLLEVINWIFVVMPHQWPPL